jgi:hypothetical protein
MLLAANRDDKSTFGDELGIAGKSAYVVDFVRP